MGKRADAAGGRGKSKPAKRRKTYRCGYIMNCSNRGPANLIGGKGYRCMWCSLTMSA